MSVLGSSVVAAVVAGLMTRSAERTKQLRERMMVVADAFASNAMEALARLRDFKPTKPKRFEVSEEFWACCDRDPGERSAYEAKAKEDYAKARWGAWAAVYEFCEVAGNQMRSP